MASAPTLSRETQQTLIQRLLNPREQSLLRMHSRGTSLDTISKLYREYEGPNGVQEALDQIKGKLERAAQARVNGTEHTPLAQKLGEEAGLDEEEAEELPEQAAEQHERERQELRERARRIGQASGQNGNMPESARPAEPARESVTPPNGAAPTSSAPTADPSPESSTPADVSPARRHMGPGRSYREELLQCLREHGPMTKVELAERTGASKSSIERCFPKLMDDGLIAEAGARPRRGRRGSPQKLWAAVGAAAPGQCSHGHAHIDCPLCAPTLPEMPAAQPQQFPPSFAAGRFDARELWESLSPERQKLLARVVLGEVVAPAITKLLLD